METHLKKISSQIHFRYRMEWVVYCIGIPFLKKILLLSPHERLRTARFKTFPRWIDKIFGKSHDKRVLNERWPEDSPLVTVIIPCFNYGNYVKEAVDSVLNQTWQDLEVIVVEGGSTDQKTPEIVRNLEGGRTRCIFKSGRSSVGENRLSGLQEARGKYIVFLDADDMLEATYLEKAVYLLETTGRDVVTPYAKLLGTKETVKRALKEGDGDVWQTNGLPVPELLDGNSCSTVAMFRLDFWKQHDLGYSTDPEFHLEDWDFWLRFAEHGARYCILPQALHLYRVHGNSLTNSLSETYANYINAVRSKWNFLRKDQRAIYSAMRRQAQTPKVIAPEINLYRKRNLEPVPPSKKRLLLCVPWFDMGGSSMLMKEIFSQLRAEIEVIAIATVPSREHFTANGLHLYQEFASECMILGEMGIQHGESEFLAYFAEQRQIDLVMVVGSTVAYAALPALKRKMPNLRVFDQLYNPFGHVGSNEKYRQWIDFNIVASGEVEKCLMDLGEHTNRIQIIPHGVDEVEFDPEHKTTHAEALVRTDSTFRFGFLGRLSEEKRPEAMLALAERLPQAEYWVGGVGPMESELKNAIAEKNLQNIHLLGFVKSPYQIYSNVDALVIPSRIEGLPITLLEAMSLEIPVIASEVGEIGNVIEMGENGFTFPAGDLDELQRLATHLMSLPKASRQKLGKSARSSILQRFTLRQCAQNYLDTFRKVLER